MTLVEGRHELKDIVIAYPIQMFVVQTLYDSAVQSGFSHKAAITYVRSVGELCARGRMLSAARNHSTPLIHGRLLKDVLYMLSSASITADAVIVFNVYNGGPSSRPIFVGKHSTWLRSGKRWHRNVSGVKYRIVVHLNKKGV